MTRIGILLERLAALAVTAALLGLLWLAVVWPVRQAFVASGQRIEQLELEEMRVERLAASLPELQERIAAAERSELADEWLVPAANANMAAAELQNRVKAVVSGVEGSVQRIEGQPVEGEGHFPTLRLSAQATVRQDRLRDLLHRLETERPRLTVDALKITTTARGVTREERPLLVLDMTLTAHLQRAEEEAIN